MDFSAGFHKLTGHEPLRWQQRLYERLRLGNVPIACDLPTGTGKTSVIALWYLARREGAALPRRLVYVVDRRVVVDQASGEAARIKKNAGDAGLRISTLRGRQQDNREWLADPAALAIIVGTVDMIGSRLLFSGYGVSRKMAPYHAGLLGADTLFVIDEAHLVPPFLHLLRAIAGEERPAPVPEMRVLPLSATGRERGGDIFRLQQDDFEDAFIRDVVHAEKRVRVAPKGELELAKALAERALELAGQSRGSRIAVFCTSRRDASEVHKRLGGADRVLLTGARRVREREGARGELERLGFLGAGGERSDPAFLVATAAGEVGVDLDADHLVCDVVAWERMVQRLGRVNRRGGVGRKADVIVVDQGPPEQSKKPTEEELQRSSIYQVVRELLQRVPDASPAALSELARCEPDKVARATTPEPLRPALTRALIEAWSLTSLEEHTGRPRVAPWLRGWVEEEPQTTVVWRKHLPPPEQAKRYFQAAPPHLSEGLKTEAWEVVEWLATRTGTRTDAGPVGFALRDGGAEAYKAAQFAASGKERTQLVSDLAGAVLVVSAGAGGLSTSGLLDSTVETEAPGADNMTPEEWAKEGAAQVPFRVEKDAEPPQDGEWQETWRCVLRRDEDGSPLEWLSVQERLAESNGDDDAAEGWKQLLAKHVAAVERHAAAIAADLALPPDLADALRQAARLHDEGKRAPRWQRAFRAPRDGQIWGKTRGPIDFGLLDHYRHEFGSLLAAEQDPALCGLAGELRDLVLHIIAAHHGWARPVIGTSGCEQLPPSALAEEARAVALRFGRVQKRWGPWGIAWIEALLRAADQAASRANDGDVKAGGRGAR
ncbi:MAG: type I-G CRISPR-associated helicase/endonuclease Cas3g [Terriglobales bacterium]